MSARQFYLRAQSFRNEGMLECNGWTRLSDEYPKNSGGDSENSYISEDCNFIINYPLSSYDGRKPFIGKIFIGSNHVVELTASTWLEHMDDFVIDENNVSDIFWKSISVPKLHVLDGLEKNQDN